MRLVQQKTIGLTTLQGENAVSPAKNRWTNAVSPAKNRWTNNDMGRKCG